MLQIAQEAEFKYREVITLLAWMSHAPRALVIVSLTLILFVQYAKGRFTSLEGFAALRSLRELDISHNGLQSMQGLDSNKELRILKIAHNQIRRVEGLEQLKLLEKVRSEGKSLLRR